MADALAISLIGPEHDGVLMTLDQWAAMDEVPGYRSELEHGVVVVTQVPAFQHMMAVVAIRDSLVAYRLAHGDRIFAVAGSGESVMHMPELETGRHPDISVYINPPPTADPQPFDTWVPEIVVEVVSESSRRRDYEIKPDDYWQAGVRLYWIVDPAARRATTLLRRAKGWQKEELAAEGVLRTGLLPGFELVLTNVFGTGA